MREIKFRAMTDYSDGNDWVYGQYAYNKETDEHFIVQSLKHVDSWEWNADGDYIDVKTLGQFTGIRDKHGKEIYEGDVVKAVKLMGVVSFKDGAFIINWETREPALLSKEVTAWKDDLIIIGNIHEEK